MHETQLRVPYGQAVYGEKEIEAVVDQLRKSTQMGDAVAKMEQRVAALFGKPHGLMVNSGSSANFLAFAALDLPKGSEVITPVLTFSTTVAPILQHGLVPVFVDVEEGTYNIDLSQVEAAISDQTRAMMIPNLLGNLPDWQGLYALAKKHDLILIEDSADTLGASVAGEVVSSLCDISTTSFYGSHVVTCAGNGGMVCFHNEQWYRRAKLLRSWGRSSSLFQASEAIENRFNVEIDAIRYDAKFIFEHFGYNFEPSEIGAAFGLVQLDALSSNLAKRISVFGQHQTLMQRYERFFVLPKTLEGAYTGWLAYPLTLKDDAPFSRTDMQIHLEKAGIQTRSIFTGNILRQPCFSQNPSLAYRAHSKYFPCADHVMRGGILLGAHHGLSDAQVEYMHEQMRSFLEAWS